MPADQNEKLLDGLNPDEPIMIGPPVVAISGKPAIAWWRELRDSEVSEIRFQSIGEDAIILAKGTVCEPALAADHSGGLLALWTQYDGPPRIHACTPATKSAPVALSARGATAPAAAFTPNGTALAVWSRIEAGSQIIEGCLGPDWTQPLILRRGWCARPQVMAIAADQFLVMWDELTPQGGSIQALQIDAGGQVSSSFTLFSAQSPTERFIRPAGAFFDDDALVCAVSVSDVADSQGIVDQLHRIVCGRVSIDSSEVLHLPSPARLDHGLLYDPEDEKPVWGYLGRRLYPGVLGGGRVWWERKERHDGLTTETAGTLCCRELDSVSNQWHEEQVLHSGGLAYDVAGDIKNSWIAHRRIIQNKGHRLLVERIDSSKPASAAKPIWTEPSGYEQIEILPTRHRDSVSEAGEDPLHLYWGDPHVHSALTLDAEGEPDELLHYARDLAGLDFVALTENDEMYSCWLTRAERLRGCALAEAWTEVGRFVALNGFEYTCPHADEAPKNHRTVLLEDRSSEFFRWSQPGITLAEAAGRVPAVLICHHQNWQLSGSSQETGIEAVSGWDTYIHRPGLIHRTWQQGQRLCLIGGSDSHRRNPGFCGACTGVWTDELSQRGIMEGIRRRRTIATQGRRPLIDFSLRDQRGTRLFIGDAGVLEGPITVNIKIEVERDFEDAIELVELRRGETLLANWSGVDTQDRGRKLVVETTPFSFNAGGQRRPLDLDPPRYLYLRVRQSGQDRRFVSNVAAARGPWAWTTPIWWQEA